MNELIILLYKSDIGENQSSYFIFEKKVVNSQSDADAL